MHLQEIHPQTRKKKTISPNSHLSLTHFQRSDDPVPSARSVDVNWRNINPGRERARQAHCRRQRPYTTETRTATKAHWRRNCLITFFFYIYFLFDLFFFFLALPLFAISFLIYSYLTLSLVSGLCGMYDIWVVGVWFMCAQCTGSRCCSVLKQRDAVFLGILCERTSKISRP